MYPFVSFNLKKINQIISINLKLRLISRNHQYLHQNNNITIGLKLKRQPLKIRQIKVNSKINFWQQLSHHHWEVQTLRGIHSIQKW